MAQKYFFDIISAMETENSEASTLLDSACDLISRGDFEAAHKKLSRAVFLEPDNFEILKTLGLVFINLERFDEAVIFFKKTVKLNKNDAVSWFYLGYCLEKNAEYQKAENAYKKVISLRKEYYDAYKSLGILYLKTGEYEKIIKNLSKIITAGAEDFQSYYILASAYMALGNEYKSAELLKSAHAIAPGHIQIINNLTSCLIATGKLDEAFTYIEKGLALDETNSQLNFNLGTIYQLKSEYAKAIECFNMAYIKDPATATLSSLAFCLMAAGRYDAAYNCYKTLHVMYPDKQNFTNNYINCAIKCEKYDEALEALEKTVEKNPRSIELIKKQGVLLRLLERYNEAIEIFDSLVKRGKIDFDVYYNLGIAQAKTTDFEGARDSLKKCIQLEPKNPAARKDLGVLYLFMNFVDWAQDELKTAYELEPDNPEYAYNYAFSLFKGGNYKEADEFYKKAVKLNKKDSMFYSSRADNLVMLGQKEAAIENYKKAILLNSKNIQANFGLAKLYFAQKNYAVALELLKDLANYTHDAEILNTLAIVYQKLKEYEKAITIYNALHKLYPENYIITTGLAECYLKMNNKKEAKKYAMEALSKYCDFEDALKILNEASKEG